MREEDLQTPPEGTQEQVDVTPEEDIQEPETPSDPQTPADEAEQPSNPQPEPPQPGQPDYKEKFQESAREAQVITERNKQIDAQLQSLTTNDPPTEAELRKEYPEWDKLDDYNQRVLRRQLATEKRAVATQKLVNDLIEERRWNDDFARVLKSNPALVGREDEFKVYAYKPTHKNAPLDVLVDSFLYKIRDQAPPPAPVRKPGLETGSGGPRTAPVSDKISLQQAGILRKTNYREYMRLLKAGKIADDPGDE